VRAAILSGVLIAGTAFGEIYELPPPGVDVIGNVVTVTAGYEDTLLDIARRHGLGYHDVVRANPDVNVWLPGEGTEVVLPTRYVLPSGPREGLILNLAEYRMYYYPKPRDGEPAYVMTYPISIGRMDWETPLGLPGYLIHGTNRPAGVGMRVTHGCIRMFPEDIEYLFDEVSVDTRVRILNEPVKVGWNGDELVMEVHPVLDEKPEVTVDEPGGEETVASEAVIGADNGDDAGDAVDDVVETGVAAVPKDPLTYATESFISATRDREGRLDWTVVETLIASADGMPATVGGSVVDSTIAVSEDDALVSQEVRID